MAAATIKRNRSRQAELQRMLGELGIVLPRQAHGTIERRAQGWYAELTDGRTVFLGDYSMLAGMEIRKLHEAATRAAA
jgi:hypothetical protein